MANETTPGVEIKVTDGNLVTKILPYAFLVYIVLSIAKMTGVIGNKK